MENKVYTIIHNLSSNNDTITTTAATITTTSSNSNSFIPLPPIDTTTTKTTGSTLETLQSVPTTQSAEVYSNNNNGSNRIITQPIFSKLIREIVKQEQCEDSSEREKYSIIKNNLPINRPKLDHIQQTSGVIPIHRNPRETTNGSSTISMANIGGHLMPTLNASHLPNGTGTYFVSGLPNDLTSNYKIPASTNSDLPSPSTSSNSSNPSSFHQHQGKRHGEGGDPTRKRQVRLQKNRDAARECRRKKKEYIKCLEERVTGLENQNKALIEELRQLKELYCQQEGTNNNTNSKPPTTTR